MIKYEEILDQARQLSSGERLRLGDALLEEELGFGMWRERTEMKSAAYVGRPPWLALTSALADTVVFILSYRGDSRARLFFRNPAIETY